MGAGPAGTDAGRCSQEQLLTEAAGSDMSNRGQMRG
jgi:hypothetical protein